MKRTITGITMMLLASLALASGTALDNTQWQLVEFQSMDDEQGTQKPDDPKMYTLSLTDDGKVAVQFNCNRGMGSWQVQPNEDGTSGRINFGPLAMTKMLCPPPSMDQHITSHTEYITSYVVKGDRLYFSLMADGGIYVWERMDADPDKAVAKKASDEATKKTTEDEPRQWTVTANLKLRDQPSTQSKVLSQFTAGTTLDNLGCQQSGGRSWCDVQQVGGGPRGFVAADYLAPAKAPDGSVPTGEDDAALRAGQGDFDVTGKLPCAQSADQAMVECEYGVARSGGGYAAVSITKPDGNSRMLFFRAGKLMGANKPMACLM